MDDCRKDEFLIIGTDINASMGVQSSHDDKVLGPWGIEKCNYNRFRGFCSTLGFCSATSFFQKKQYGTWIHPHSKFPYQLDHFLVIQSNMKCVSDAGPFGVYPVDSDHAPIRVYVQVAWNLKRKVRNDCHAFLRRSLLQSKEIRKTFQNATGSISWRS